MATPKATLWELDPHTIAKHEILVRYLGAWFPILNAHHGRIVYIDGFSGPGRYSQGEPGSPILALDVAVNHRKSMSGELVFLFIEEREDRLSHLRHELSAIPVPAHFKVIAEPGRFDERLSQVLDSIDADSSTLAPTFAFVDPFGFSGIPFSLLERLLRKKRCEVFVTFMADAINRFLEHPDDKVVKHIVEAFGGNDAIAIANGGGDRVGNLRKLYQSKLKSVAKYVRYFEMRDRVDRTQYYLFFASNSAVGHVKMKEAMWRVDPAGEFSFSDATNPDQFVLFDDDPTGNLASQIRPRLGVGRKVTCLQVREFVENDTAYLKKHMIAVLKRDEEQGLLQVDAVKSNGRRRIAGTFPDEVTLQWL